MRYAGNLDFKIVTDRRDTNYRSSIHEVTIPEKPLPNQTANNDQWKVLNADLFDLKLKQEVISPKIVKPQNRPGALQDSSVRYVELGRQQSPASSASKRDGSKLTTNT